MTWNCRGGFRKKVKHIASFRPDVLVVQEVEAIANVLLLGGEHHPTSGRRIGRPAPIKGVAVLSYTDTKLQYVDSEIEAERVRGFHRFEAQRQNLTFNVASVWTSFRKEREDTFRQAHKGIKKYRAWIEQRDTVILGDFNNNASYKYRDWVGLARSQGGPVAGRNEPPG
jgi:endonuclease/exonuclease/phosphatase family metal-dependent hydrolase